MSGHECAPCGRQFRLYQHYQDHMIHSSQHHYCAPCRRDFVSQNALDSHLRHSERHLICKWCQTVVGKLRIHNRRHHEQCSECDQWLENATDVHRHCALAHSEVYCVPCRRLFGNPNELKMHLRSSAHRPRNIECVHPACNRSFISKAALVQHLEADTCPSGASLQKVDHYFSYHCDRSQRFVRRDLLFHSSLRLEHNLRDNNGRYPCQLCSKVFQHKGELVAHVKSSKHKNLGDKAYKCPSNRCGQAEFYSLGNLMMHLDFGDCDVSHARELYELVDDLLEIVRRL
ncbi:hypothetical protein PTTG_05343 [Puccinia triticina 1-1 BBBD Race 1]|uniref:C2H2-type domain-containing protein n=2 Tax=Puccinia triticina TaxID=208348 RepID=A0A0C4EWZ6_PUCT1|nr:uncharacterized protein PtA15_5A615 [Puccinia triticina]OAV98794.1 hypothetical protein PTTG_05343 [Puccinia triticina 1-1 BBBD Race 1]WAQ85041.1 hypothetical protein PtA15_5A615 [Puccinia triticina]WAR58376.1 hypothetical protein PtB15_5B610 [Puccinia triticina]